MLKVYFDESGDLGFHKGYFVIAMVVAHNPSRLKNFIKDFCAKNELEEVHSHALTVPKKQWLINKLVKYPDHNISYIVADKTMIKNQALFKSNNLLFNYLFSLLVEDLFRTNSEGISMILDNRTQKVASLNSLEDYIKISAYTKWGFTKSVSLQYMDSKVCKALQVADLVANSVWRRYRKEKDDFYSQLAINKSIRFPHNSFRLNLYKIKVDKRITQFYNKDDINPMGSSLQ